MQIADRGTADIYDDIDSEAARRTLPLKLVAVALRKIGYLNAAVTLDALRMPPGNELEALAGDRAGQHSIRINDQYRICFAWTESGATGVEIVDHH